MKTKPQWRQFAKDILEQISLIERDKLSKQISNQLAQVLNQIHSTQFMEQEFLRIGAFAPIQKEVLWFKSKLLEKHCFSFPKLSKEDHSMVFYEAPIKSLQDELWGISVPEQYCQKPKDEHDVLLIPGLLFTPRGQRLGRGAGYYDRYLEKSKAIRIAVCFEKQIVNELETQKHDELMDFVVTEENIYTRGK